ncbi:MULTISPECIES: hypothetical protein [unclassified Rhizobium]|uniref:hypothetical protein n=1 Tax=unclassified Rhizobium TaxID=2613769 RepID=UPI0013C4F67E|nr:MULTISPECIES: hypothetical protein [unclassified Rhizobium]
MKQTKEPAYEKVHARRFRNHVRSRVGLGAREFQHPEHRKYERKCQGLEQSEFENGNPERPLAFEEAELDGEGQDKIIKRILFTCQSRCAWKKGATSQ